jgi:hypothetical protein
MHIVTYEPGYCLRIVEIQDRQQLAQQYSLASAAEGAEAQ